MRRAEEGRWVFDELPPSGARRGDDPAQHAFAPTLASFVREVIQNANDQAIGAPTVAFAARSVTGDELARLRRVLDLERLEQHLAATASSRAGRRIAAALDRFARARSMPVLVVEDRGTVGLSGDEDEPDGHFRALCKDTLFSQKRESQAAGGSYGLGKSVLWAFSGLRTVMFASSLARDPAGRRSPRFFGRSELPSHQTEGGAWAGPGWFGRRVERGAGRARAESLWDEAAARLCEALGVDIPSPSGTAILVLGVHEPAADDDEDEDPRHTPARLLAQIGAHAAREFWPAMLREVDPLTVLVDGRPVTPLADVGVASFAACLATRDVTPSVPQRDGEIALRRIEVELPRRRDEARRATVSVDLVVRLAESSERPGTGRIALFRGPGMVVRHWDATRLASGLRPFHAILRCGLARGDAPEDLALERFLRAAEPPGHDDWIATATVKDEYVRGAAATLTQLYDRVVHELRSLLAPATEAGQRGPEKLRRRFEFGKTGARTGSSPAIGFGALEATVRDNRWHFEGEIRPRRSSGAWRTQLAVRQVGEDGGLGDDVPIDSLEVDVNAVARLDRGRVHIEGNAGAAVRFFGTTAVLRGAHAWTGEVALELVASTDTPGSSGPGGSP